jgi:hypothetical protein
MARSDERTILVISTDPIAEGIDDLYGISGINWIIARSEYASGLLELRRQRLTITAQEINGGLEIDTLGLHNDCNNVSTAVTLGLLHVVRKEILNDESGGDTTRQSVKSYIGPKD